MAAPEGKRTPWIAFGAASMALCVALGAFGAHALATRVPASELEIWKTAVLYHALHALGLIAFGLFRERRGGGGLVGWAFALGTLLFCGSLFAMVLGGPRWLGMVTPLGGVLWIVGWLALAREGLRSR
jgi:uncharacterized membrane protein YgdD (TMEM256/DUF423 family)